MNGRPLLLFTRDPAVEERMRVALGVDLPPTPVASPGVMASLLYRYDPVAAIIDIRDDADAETALGWLRAWPRSVFIVLVDRGSAVARSLADAGAYAVEDRSCDPGCVAAMARRAAAQAGRCEIPGRVSADVHPLDGGGLPPPAASAGSAAAPLWHLLLTLRGAADADSLYARAVEAVSSMWLLSRAGVLATSGDDALYRLRAGHGCLPAITSAVFGPGDLLVRYLGRHGHVLSAETLAYVRDPAERRLLALVLDEVGAEVIAPFFAGGRLFGWLFLGRRMTGAPFDRADLEVIAVFAAHVAAAVESIRAGMESANAACEADAVLASLPCGVLAVGPDGVIRSCNEEAVRLLGRGGVPLIGRPVEAAGERAAAALRAALAGRRTAEEEWSDPATGACVGVTIRRLETGGVCAGAVALFEDCARRRRIAARMGAAVETSLWRELASAMAHEIRNPLTAIKAHAQLLPDRYGDPGFRDVFGRIVAGEVRRLEGVVESLESFAHPPARAMGPLDVHRLLEEAAAEARRRMPAEGGRIEMRVADDLPAAVGDASALSGAIAHLIVNAMESRPDPASLTVVVAAERAAEGAWALTISDNGPGISAAVRGRMFSPFITTKARGLGLGLPIVRRVALDHGGEVRVDSDDNGTRVTMVLPLRPPGDAAGPAADVSGTGRFGLDETPGGAATPP